MNRAFSILDVKSIGEGGRRFAGIATTPTFDRVNDSINPLGAKFAAEIPLLHGHRHDAPIGHVRLGKPTKSGIPFEAVIPVIHEPPTLKERVDVAAAEIAHGLIKAVSVGFRPISNPKLNSKGGVDFDEIEIYELSTVSIPANAEALISVVKSFDDAAMKAAGIEVGETFVVQGKPCYDPRIALKSPQESGMLIPETLRELFNKISAEPEIPAEPLKADATVKALPVVKLVPPATGPHVIRKVHPLRK